MSVFQKKITTRNISILGKKYTVDFGRDSLAGVFQEVQEGLEEIIAKRKEIQPYGKMEIQKMQEDEKRLLKSTIEAILCSVLEVDPILVEDNELFIYREIYAYLTTEFIHVLQAKSPYSVERIAGYESFN